MLDAADEEHMRRIRVENERGGEAREVVAAVARALDVDIDKGPGHRWDLDHMRRVVAAAESLVQERDDLHQEFHAQAELLRQARDQRNVWKESFEKVDAQLVQPLRRELREERDKNEALSAEKRAARAADGRRTVLHPVFGVETRFYPDAPDTAYVDELHAVIVSQAREIARLKGESE
ncbi:hypothetical protein AB0N28_03680 [Streptomyces sp. NPDC051130]|uniref:hypothetical protein n=1 Tax=Streptomyces sp. NPDC051130 TaxID=3157223 RepID=UPI00343BCE22